MDYTGVAVNALSSQENADVRQMINEAMGAVIAPIVMNVTPTEGQTITIPSTDKEVILNLTPAVDLNALQVNLPNNANGRQGQRIFVGSTRQIAACTFAGGLQVNNGSFMFSRGDNVAFIRNMPNIWSRIIS